MRGRKEVFRQAGRQAGRQTDEKVGREGTLYTCREREREPSPLLAPLLLPLISTITASHQHHHGR
jgi:hypothetical protein